MIKFLTNSYVVVACREAAQNKIIKAPLLSLHKKSLHAINSQVLPKLDSFTCELVTSVKIYYNAKHEITIVFVGNIF